MKLLFLNGSRGEWGYIRPIIDECRSRDVEYSIIATNMLMMRDHGSLLNDIRSQGYNICDELLMSFSESDHFSFTKSMGVLLLGLVETIRREKPTWLILAGDRGEQLIGAIAASYTYTPVAHIQAGERSGNIDGVARHAIGKLVHMHFAANDDASQRLLALGEEPHRIHNVGAPQLDEITQSQLPTHDSLIKRYNLNFDRPHLLCVFHPVTEELSQVSTQIRVLCEALKKSKLPKIWIMPNNDAGGQLVRDVIQEKRASDWILFSNLNRADYLGLLRDAAAIIGNSSSGLLEAPSFQTAAINLGRRQTDRVQGDNVLNGDFDEDQILHLIQLATSSSFQQSLLSCTNPYGDGKSSPKILDLLLNTPIDDTLLMRNITK